VAEGRVPGLTRSGRFAAHNPTLRRCLGSRRSAAYDRALSERRRQTPLALPCDVVPQLRSEEASETAAAIVVWVTVEEILSELRQAGDRSESRR
jgi:hypothetical protein